MNRAGEPAQAREEEESGNGTAVRREEDEAFRLLSAAVLVGSPDLARTEGQADFEIPGDNTRWKPLRDRIAGRARGD